MLLWVRNSFLSSSRRFSFFWMTALFSLRASWKSVSFGEEARASVSCWLDRFCLFFVAGKEMGNEYGVGFVSHTSLHPKQAHPKAPPQTYQMHDRVLELHNLTSQLLRLQLGVGAAPGHGLVDGGGRGRSVEGKEAGGGRFLMCCFGLAWLLA